MSPKQTKGQTTMNFDFGSFEVVDVVERGPGGRPTPTLGVTITAKGRITLSSLSSASVVDGEYTHATILRNSKFNGNGAQYALRFSKGPDKSVVPAKNCVAVQVNAKTKLVGLGLATTIRSLGYDFATLNTQRFTPEEAKDKQGRLYMVWTVASDLKPSVVTGAKRGRKPKAAAASTSEVTGAAPELSVADVAA